MLNRNEDVRRPQITKHKVVYVQDIQSPGDLVANSGRSSLRIPVEDLIDVLHDDYYEIAECESVSTEKWGRESAGSEQGVRCLVVDFRKLDDNLPVVLGVGDEDHLVVLMIRIPVHSTAELNFLSRVLPVKDAM